MKNRNAKTLTVCIEYRLPREALWLVAAAMTINPVSIFSGNVA